MKFPKTRGAFLNRMLANIRVGVVEVRPAVLDPSDCDAKCEWGWVGGVLHLKIKRDDAQGGYVRQVVHESIHAHLHDSLATLLSGELHEGALRGIEDACMKHLEKRRNRRVYERWRVAIAAKMEGA